MSISVQDFMAKHATKGVGRVSEMKEHQAAILKLRDEGYTYSQICDFLKENGVTVKVPTVASFIKRTRDAAAPDGAGYA